MLRSNLIAEFDDLNSEAAVQNQFQGAHSNNKLQFLISVSYFFSIAICGLRLRSAGCGRWLVLIYCERKVLLVGWWLMADADLMYEKNTAGWLADKSAEQSVSLANLLYFRMNPTLMLAIQCHIWIRA